jgi:hypothetical protein
MPEYSRPAVAAGAVDEDAAALGVFFELCAKDRQAVRARMNAKTWARAEFIKNLLLAHGTPAESLSLRPSDYFVPQSPPASKI